MTELTSIAIESTSSRSIGVSYTSVERSIAVLSTFSAILDVNIERVCKVSLEAVYLLAEISGL